MNKTLKIIFIVLLVLAVPGGIAAYFLLKPRKSVTSITSGDNTDITMEYRVGDGGNPTDAADEANSQFDTGALIDYLGVDEKTFYALNPDVERGSVLPFGYIVNIPKI